MSLLIVGSVSRITHNIILQLSKQNTFKTITISDLLPTYCFHERFYNLQKELAGQNSTTQVKLNKLTRVQQLYHQIQDHQSILYVTHDYFTSVTSKTKLMELTADFSKNKQNVHFATPIEYDHFGYENPIQNYHNSQAKVIHINKNATIYRSDIQDGAQTLAYINTPKGLIEDIFFSVPDSFSPKVVSSTNYAEAVASGLANKGKDRVVSFNGTTSDYKVVGYNKQITKTCHFKDNVRNLLKKYTGLPKVATQV